MDIICLGNPCCTSDTLQPPLAAEHDQLAPPRGAASGFRRKVPLKDAYTLLLLLPDCLKLLSVIFYEQGLSHDARVGPDHQRREL